MEVSERGLRNRATSTEIPRVYRLPLISRRAWTQSVVKLDVCGVLHFLLNSSIQQKKKTFEAECIPGVSNNGPKIQKEPKKGYYVTEGSGLSILLHPWRLANSRFESGIGFLLHVL